MKTLITNTFYLLLASMAICLFSCNNPKPLKSAQRRPIIIDLQPFQDITAQAQNDIVNQLRTVYPHVRLLGAIQLPKLAFYAARNRYRADSLINYLK
jgi:archaemetzincin